jgi:hypothetical protein
MDTAVMHLGADTTLARRLDSARAAKAKAAGADTVAEQWTKSRRECELATREYNRFMR